MSTFAASRGEAITSSREPAPVEPQARLEEQPRRRLPAVEHPGAGAQRVAGRVEQRREPRPAPDARPVRLTEVAVPGNAPAPRRRERVRFEPGLQQVLGRRLERELLPDRHVAHREVTREHDVRPRERVVAGRIRAGRLVAQVAVDVDPVAVAVPRDDAAGGRPRAQRREPRQRHDVVARGVLEPQRAARGLLVELGVGALAAAQREERKPLAGPRFPQALGLQVRERRQVLARDAVGHEVIVGPSPADQPRALDVARQLALEHDVGVGQAQGGRSRNRAGPCAGAVLDEQDRGHPVAVLRAEAARGELEVLHRLRVEGTRQAEQAIRVVDLDAVHEREVLIRAAAPDGEPAPEIVGGVHARQGLQHAEHVLGRARDGAHVEWAHVNRRWRPRGRVLSGRDDDLLPELRPIEQQDLDDRHRLADGQLHALVEVPVRRDGQSDGSARQGQGEASVLAGDRGAVAGGNGRPRHGAHRERVDDASRDWRRDGRVNRLRFGGWGRERGARDGQRGEEHPGQTAETTHHARW